MDNSNLTFQEYLDTLAKEGYPQVTVAEVDLAYEELLAEERRFRPQSPEEAARIQAEEAQAWDWFNQEQAAKLSAQEEDSDSHCDDCSDDHQGTPEDAGDVHTGAFSLD